MRRTSRWMLALGIAIVLGIVPIAGQDTTPEAAAQPVTTLRIWFPDTLGSTDDGEVAALLAELVGEFQTTNGDVQVDFRLKRAGDISTPGTLYHNLRTTRATAPGALPHLTLLRRSDLDFAVREGLITPFLETREAALLDGVLPAAAALGEVEGTLFGIPFMLEVEHQAHQPDLETPRSWSFDDVLAGEWRFVFPGGETTRVSSELIAQIAEAGGLDENGRLAPDLETLTRIYQFYEDALEIGLLPPETVSYEAPADYLPLLTTAELPAGMLASSEYLRLLDQGSELLAAPLPTVGGDPASVLNGWLWVLPTGTPEERALALRFIDWMDEPARQAEYARAVNQIPAQVDAFSVWAEGEYGAMITDLLSHGVLLPIDRAATQPALARALQIGLTQVLNGSATAAQAAETALDSTE
ncbi:MAG TPA: extracellular solute-binding protein [Candidatus Limnocylindrales bacterium]|nr:extracellular solute-binding protein [Candidatus Limnocylindrales bacterium]